MQFKSIVVAFATLALVNGAPGPRRRPGGGPPVCGGNTIAACCETDTSYGGEEESTDCISPGNPTGINNFRKRCAATGRTAQCCETLVDGTGTECQDV